MQINIETYNGSDEIDQVTVKVFGDANGKALLAKLVPQPQPKAPFRGVEAPSRCTLREAVELFRELAEEVKPSLLAPNDKARERAEVIAAAAKMLEQLANGDKKIQAIKALRELSGLGLKEAKEMTERAAPFRPAPHHRV